jgi:hypothetical protein
MSNDRYGSRGNSEKRQLIELRGIERAAEAAGRVPDQAKQRQPGRQADRDDNHPDSLHDGDGAHVRAEFGGNPHDLRQPARCGGEVCGN